MGRGLQILTDESKGMVNEAKANARMVTTDAVAHRERIRR